MDRGLFRFRVPANLASRTRAFQVSDVRLGAGANEYRHVHIFPTVTVMISGQAIVRGSTADKVLDHPGAWVAIPAGAFHTLVAVGKGDAYVVEIEVR